jgi:nucleoid DNA-binding protein
MEKTKGLLQNRLESARQDALGKVDELQQRMHEMQDFEKLDHSEQEQLDQSFKDVRYAIENQSLSVSIRDKIGTYEVDEYPQLLTRMMQKANKGQAGGDDQGNGKPIPQIIHVSYLPFVAPKKFLENKEDVEEYLDALRKALVKALKDNNHIQI